jgi:hypothetical protein
MRPLGERCLRGCVGLPTVDLHPRTNLFRVSTRALDGIENVLNDSPPGQQRQTAVPAPAADLDGRKAETLSDAQGRVSQYVMAHAMSPQNVVLSRGVLTTECRHTHLSLIECAFAPPEGTMLPNVFAVAD